MDYFTEKNGEIYAEEVALTKIAEAVGTPAYIYSQATLDRHCLRLKEAFRSYPTLPCFAVKANHNINVLRRIFSHGFGADVVSVGEMERALLAGVNPQEIVFSGVGKQEYEIQRGLEVGILSFNVESAHELELIAQKAKQMNQVASVSLRVNPNIDAKTNPYIATGLYTTKFGIAENDIMALLQTIKNHPNIRVLGLACHIGSQITEIGPFREAIARMVQLSQELIASGFGLKTVNLGGGLGIKYHDESPPSLEDYAQTLISEVKNTALKLLIEPGRTIVGNVGVLLTKVLHVKKNAKKTFVIVDGAMNDLIRPSLYESYHSIEPVKTTSAEKTLCDVVGPICETGDFLGLNRELRLAQPGDLMVIRGAGAYGATMASNYNTRPRAPEVMVEGDKFRVIRRRETFEDLIGLEVESQQNRSLK